MQPLTITVSERQLRVSEPGRDGVILRLKSDRNTVVPTLTDRSPYAPQRTASVGTRSAILSQMLYFPVVDVRLIDGISARMTFTGNGVGTAVFAVNGQFHPIEETTTPVATVSASRLEHWENSVFVEGADCRLVDFVLEVPLEGEQAVEFELLTDQWAGTVEVLDAHGDIVARGDIARNPAPSQTPSNAPALSRERLQVALDATLAYVLRSINDNAASPTADGMFLFYDHDARTFRTSHWNWTWGPAIRLLLDARVQAAATTGRSVAEIEAAALAMGRASLKFQIDDSAHPADGFVMVRWSPGLKNERSTGYLSPSSPDFPVDGWAPSHAGEHFVHGYEAYVSPADALFLAGWGWVPLYREFGDDAFLKATRKMVDATRRLTEDYEIIPQDMPLAVGEWTDYTREEAGFGGVGLAEYAQLTGEEPDARLGRRYMDQLLDKLERPDGLWNRHWWRSEQRTTGCEYKSRSLGWATMGLIWSHEMAPGAGYLEKAERLAQHFVDMQHPPGYWGLVINKPIGDTEISIKGTALWSMLLYRLHKLTGKDSYLASARRALAFLVEHQYLGEDSDGHGGLISCSAFSGVDYRRWFRLSCGYSSSFFGLALLSELALQETGH